MKKILTTVTLCVMSAISVCSTNYCPTPNDPSSWIKYPGYTIMYIADRDNASGECVIDFDDKGIYYGNFQYCQPEKNHWWVVKVNDKNILLTKGTLFKTSYANYVAANSDMSFWNYIENSNNVSFWLGDEWKGNNLVKLTDKELAALLKGAMNLNIKNHTGDPATGYMKDYVRIPKVSIGPGYHHTNMYGRDVYADVMWGDFMYYALATFKKENTGWNISKDSVSFSYGPAVMSIDYYIDEERYQWLDKNTTSVYKRQDAKALSISSVDDKFKKEFKEAAKQRMAEYEQEFSKKSTTYPYYKEVRSGSTLTAIQVEDVLKTHVEPENTQDPQLSYYQYKRFNVNPSYKDLQKPSALDDIVDAIVLSACPGEIEILIVDCYGKTRIADYRANADASKWEFVGERDWNEVEKYKDLYDQQRAAFDSYLAQNPKVLPSIAKDLKNWEKKVRPFSEYRNSYARCISLMNTYFRRTQDLKLMDQYCANIDTINFYVSKLNALPSNLKNFKAATKLFIPSTQYDLRDWVYSVNSQAKSMADLKYFYIISQSANGEQINSLIKGLKDKQQILTICAQNSQISHPKESVQLVSYIPFDANKYLQFLSFSFGFWIGDAFGADADKARNATFFNLSSICPEKCASMAVYHDFGTYGEVNRRKEEINYKSLLSFYMNDLYREALDARIEEKGLYADMIIDIRNIIPTIPGEHKSLNRDEPTAKAFEYMQDSENPVYKWLLTKLSEMINSGRASEVVAFLNAQNELIDTPKGKMKRWDYAFRKRPKHGELFKPAFDNMLQAATNNDAASAKKIAKAFDTFDLTYDFMKTQEGLNIEWMADAQD